MKKTELLYGQVGGTLNAFIGAVHRKAIAIDEQARLVAGCFSASNPESNKKCAEHYKIVPQRTYSNYIEMLECESKKTQDRLDFVVVCTPNNTHYEICKAFIEKGFNVVCEKPLCFTSEQALELKSLAEKYDIMFCVTYTYTGYNMIKQAKQIVSEGIIGDIVDVKGEYLQDWLISQVDSTTDEQTKLSVWRMNPKYSGISNCVGDIGTHIEATVSYVTGLRVKKVAAILDKYGKELDLNANILVEFDNGVHGTFACSQVMAGHYNGLVIRVFGTKGSIEWEQEHPDFLKLTIKGMPTQILTRASHTTDHAAEINRIPAGHPEGLTMAFANIYKSYTSALLRKINAEGNDGKWDLDFPSIQDGLYGVKFIEACVRSSENGASWEII